jgi:hypothetical protein
MAENRMRRSETVFEVSETVPEVSWNQGEEDTVALKKFIITLRDGQVLIASIE